MYSAGVGTEVRVVVVAVVVVVVGGGGLVVVVVVIAVVDHVRVHVHVREDVHVVVVERCVLVVDAGGRPCTQLVPVVLVGSKLYESVLDHEQQFQTIRSAS